jgi:hypothetical protein
LHSPTYQIIFKTEITGCQVYGFTEGKTIRELSPRVMASFAVVVARSLIVFSKTDSSVLVSIDGVYLKKFHLRDGGILLIIKAVSLDVLPEESQIFHDCESPFRRTMRPMGDTGQLARFQYNLGMQTYRNIAIGLCHACLHALLGIDT